LARKGKQKRGTTLDDLTEVWHRPRSYDSFFAEEEKEKEREKKRHGAHLADAVANRTRRDDESAWSASWDKKEGGEKKRRKKSLPAVPRFAFSQTAATIAGGRKERYEERSRRGGKKEGRPLRLPAAHLNRTIRGGPGPHHGLLEPWPGSGKRGEEKKEKEERKGPLPARPAGLQFPLRNIQQQVGRVPGTAAVRTPSGKEKKERGNPPPRWTSSSLPFSRLVGEGGAVVAARYGALKRETGKGRKKKKKREGGGGQGKGPSPGVHGCSRRSPYRVAGATTDNAG